MARRVVPLLAEKGAIAIKVRELLPVELLEPVVEEAHRLGLKVTGHLRATDARQAALAGIDGLEHASGLVQATIDPWISIDLDTLEARDIYAKYVAERKAYALINEHRAGELVTMLAGRQVALIPTMSGWWRMASDRRDTFAAEDAVYAEDAALSVRARRRRDRSGRRRSCTRSTIRTISPSWESATARSRRCCVATARPAARCSPAPTRTSPFRG